MSDAYLVDVDLERLRAHRSRAEHREISESEARAWLVRYGFYPRTDGLYVAEDAVLRQLDPSVIIAARPVGLMTLH